LPEQSSRSLQLQEEPKMSTTLTVPAQVVTFVRSALHTELGSAAEALAGVVERRGHEDHPEWFAEPLQRHDATRALLDVIGWGNTDQTGDVRVDLCTHRETLTAALDVAMCVGDEELAEAKRVDAESRKRGEPPKRDAIARRVLALRKFVAAVEALPLTERGDA
jgi:hypothetical protein